MALPSVPTELMVSRARALAATPWPALLAVTLKFKALAPLYWLASQANSCRPAAMLPSFRVSTNWPPAEKICTLTLSAALASSADKVSVQILSPGGQLLDTLDLGGMAAGRQQFSWDASKYTGGGNLSFKVTASNAGQAIPATALARDTISSVGTDGSAMSIALKSGATVRYEQIKAVL